MKVAVFGGSGFLGSYIVGELLSRSYEVLVLDVYRSEYISEDHYYYLDILNKEELANLFKTHDFDVVYNLAGFANLDKAINFPHRTFELNVMGNLNILEEVIKKGVKRYVFASSAYAMSDKGSFYGISKLSSEKIIEEYQKRHDLNFTILRYGSVYSERAFENNYIYNLVESAIKTQKIDHHGDGEEIREYIHALDAAILSVNVIEDEKYKNTHLILTGVERLKRLELFNMIKEIIGTPLDIALSKTGYENHYKYTPYSFNPETSQKLLPNPYIDMGQGLLNCIKEVAKKNN
jgi:UDP-glucose 4-epimerase